MAGHLVSGISEYEAEKEDPGYDTRREDLRALQHDIRDTCSEEKAKSGQALLCLA